jgi:hypothetical protein
VDDRQPEWPEDLAALLAMCTSCRRLHPEGYACACLVTRARTLAEVLHDLRRVALPRWRRPRSWTALPEPVRQDRTMDGLTLVDALEGSGWRLVWIAAEGTHVLPEDYVSAAHEVPADRFEPDPDAVTPPSGEFRVPNVVR